MKKHNYTPVLRDQIPNTKILINKYSIDQPTSSNDDFEKDESHLILKLTFKSNDYSPNKYEKFLIEFQKFLIEKNYSIYKPSFFDK